MKLNFPASGSIVVNKPDAEAPTRFLTAPLEAKFPLQPDSVAKEGQNYTLRDEAGTALIYRITGVEWLIQDMPLLSGSLVGVEHTEQNVIPVAEHDARLSQMIDLAFDAGRQVGVQEQTEAYEQRQKDLADGMFVDLDEPTTVVVRFADTSVSAFLAVTAFSEIDGNLSFETIDGNLITVHPSWRTYELQVPDLVDEDDDDVELINPLAPVKGEVTECGCDTCQTLRATEAAAKVVWDGIWRDREINLAEPAGYKPLWKPRFGPIGNRLDD